jgi:hypothetical protein
MTDPLHRLEMIDAPMITLGSLLEMLREEGMTLIKVLDDPEAVKEYDSHRCRHVLTLAEAASELHDTIGDHLRVLGKELKA